jgi:hypothetical protein
MTETHQPSGLRHLLYPQCPYNNSVVVLASRIALVALGTIGLTFLHPWVAVVYLIYAAGFSFLAWPVKHCQYCYFKITESTTDEKTGETMLTLMPTEEWTDSYLQKHVACGKKWGKNLAILWFFPIPLIGISFLLNFSIVAVISLIGFIGALAVMLTYTRYKICPTCAIVEECHAAF